MKQKALLLSCPNLLLHFTNIDRDMDEKQVEKELKKYLPNYKKGFEGGQAAFEDTKDRLQEAMQRSKNFWEKEEKGSYTNLHELIHIFENVD